MEKSLLTLWENHQTVRPTLSYQKKKETKNPEKYELLFTIEKEKNVWIY